MKQVIEERNIRLQVAARNWEEALKISGDLLVASNYVKPAYVQMTIDAVKELGPYIVIAPGLALAHARPDVSVLKTGISLITLTKEVEFGSELGPVKVVITLASVDNEVHLDKLQVLAEVFSDESKMKKICYEKEPAEVAYMLNNNVVDVM